MKKKIVSAILSAVILAGAICGCGSSTSESSSGTESQSSSAVSTSQDASAAGTAAAGTDGTATSDSTDGEYPVIRLNYCVIFDSYDEAAIEDALNKIMREKAHAEVDLVGIEFGNWSTQLSLMLTGGDNALDLYTSFWYTSLNNLVVNGQAIALDDLLQSDGQGILDAYKGKESYLNCGKVNGSLYGIPSIYAWDNQMEYMVKKEDSDKANINWSNVNNINDLTDALLSLKEANPDKYFIPGSTSTYWVPKDIDYLGDENFLGVLTDPLHSTKVENYYESDYFNNFLDQVQIWADHDIFSPDPMSNNVGTLGNIQNGVVDGSTGYGWDAEESIASNARQTGFELTGGAISEPLATTSAVTTYMWHISPFCEHPDAAMRVLDVLMTDPEAANIVANGLEGRQYDLDENGHMTYHDGKQLTDLGWYAASMAVWPNVTIGKVWDYEDPDIYKKMNEKNDTAAKSLALGFQFDSTDVADQVTACSNVVSQYYLPLIYAQTDRESTLKEFNEQLKAAGLDDIIAAKQEQLDAWLANQ